MTFRKYAEETYWSDDDRFAVVPTPEGWVGMDYGTPLDGKRGPIAFSDPCETVEEGQAWCEERMADPAVKVG